MVSLSSSFLEGKSVLVTGVTGFVGKAVLESLLRDHSLHMKKIYCLVRSKGEQTAQQRLEQVLENELFDQIHHGSSKLVAVDGDMSAVGLGISHEDLKMLQGDLDVAIHMAASVSFDSPLLQAFETNTRGSVELMQICESCPQFQGLVYVSTAYANTNLEPGVIDEKLYEMPLGEPAALYGEIKAMDEHQALEFSTKVLKQYPSTYVFVKALTEHVLMAHAKVAIARLSIVTSTIQDPIPGWSDGHMGANGAAIYVGTGILDSLLGRPEVIMDCVPVDYATNCILRICHHLLANSTNAIFHLASSTINPLPYGVFFDAILAAWRQLPPLNSRIFPPDFHFVASPTAHTERLNAIKEFKFHTLPRLIADKNYAARLARAEKKLDKFHANFDALIAAPWIFQTSNMLSLEASQAHLTTITSSNVNSTCLRCLDWPSYFFNFIHGIHRFVLKEPSPHNPAMPHLAAVQSHV
ncbi:hypothetical protein DSO57_1035628 [Entomophthora muscae]|uniref:Uncharacterized protein n=1 Tax=Entomophthora muscae TaxID=34485 RepID=A0ACC2TY65_9FUNG|nr:hypothetical protein DSO57_1035628 [Entomophthora muscae]